ncbi:MAG: tyrosine-protein phosphatase [Planctomycetota bacterium]|nr:tyrosine-protein phosphatase [Planctomycetota bacterium]
MIEGALYRSGQLSTSELVQCIEKYGIRSVLSLRRAGAEGGEEEAEIAACQDHHVEFRHVPLSPTHLPRPEALHDLLIALKELPPPLLIHCHQGTDRTGLACVVYLVVMRGSDLNEALRSQLCLRSGHFAWGQAHAMDDFFALYCRTSNQRSLANWIEEDYRGEVQAETTASVELRSANQTSGDSQPPESRGTPTPHLGVRVSE